MDRASASGFVDSGIPFQIRSNQWLNNWYSQISCLTFNIIGIVRSKPGSSLVVPLRKALNGISPCHLNVADRWPATPSPKRARLALVGFS